MKMRLALALIIVATLARESDSAGASAKSGGGGGRESNVNNKVHNENNNLDPYRYYRNDREMLDYDQVETNEGQYPGVARGAYMADQGDDYDAQIPPDTCKLSVRCNVKDGSQAARSGKVDVKLPIRGPRGEKGPSSLFTLPFCMVQVIYWKRLTFSCISQYALSIH